MGCTLKTAIIAIRPVFCHVVQRGFEIPKRLVETFYKNIFHILHCKTQSALAKILVWNGVLTERVSKQLRSSCRCKNPPPQFSSDSLYPRKSNITCHTLSRAYKAHFAFAATAGTLFATTHHWPLPPKPKTPMAFASCP